MKPNEKQCSICGAKGVTEMDVHGPCGFVDGDTGTTPPPSTAEFEPLLRGELKHGRSCPAVGAPMDEGNCDCGLKWRIRLQTEMTLRNAWEKRAYEAEAALAAAERGTTPPEGLAFTFEEFIDMSLRHNKRLAAGISGIASFGHWYNEMLAATQRAPVEQGPQQPGMTVAGWGLPVDAAPWEIANSLVQPLRPDGYLEARVVSLRRDDEDAEETVALFTGPNRDANAGAVVALVNRAPDHAREGALRGLVAKWRDTKGEGYLRRNCTECDAQCADELERALADGKEGGE